MTTQIIEIKTQFATTICIWQNTPTNDDGHSSILANDLLATLDLVMNMRTGVSITRAVCACKLANKVSASVLTCKDLATTQANTIPPTPSSFPQSSIEQ